MGRAWHHISLDFCRFRLYHLTRCSSFQRVSNHSIKEKERTAETFQYPVIKYVRYGPSTRCYMWAVICYRWILPSLSNSRYTASLHARRGNCFVHIHSNTLFDLSSGTDYMGEFRGHSKMEGLRSYSDQKALEKAGVNSLDFSNGVRIEPKPHYYGGRWTEHGCNSSSCNSCVMVYIKIRKQRFNQIFPVNMVETMKLEYRVEKTDWFGYSSPDSFPRFCCYSLFIGRIFSNSL